MKARLDSVPSSRRILAVFNPTSGRGRRARFNRVLTALHSHGCVVTLAETSRVGHAEQIAYEVSASDFDVIAAAGGDGTVNEVINGLVGKDLALGLIPLGTANVLAREIGLRFTAEDIARALAFGPIKPSRVGRVNGRRFTMMAGVGFDADAVEGVSLKLKKRFGPLAYIWQALVQYKTKGLPDCEIDIDGTMHRSASVLICKGSRYGGSFIAAPEASLSVDHFHVILMPGRSGLSLLRYGLALVRGSLTRLPEVTVVVGRDIVVNSVAGQPVQADGDILARLPVHITLDPSPVRLVYPA